MTTATQEKLNPVIVQFSKDQDIIDFVKKTEGRTATTQGHYGDYMAFLTPFTKDKLSLYVMSEALKLAGADVQGVQGAMMILNG
jgi:hypothetical protein